MGRNCTWSPISDLAPIWGIKRATWLWAWENVTAWQGRLFLFVAHFFVLSSFWMQMSQRSESKCYFIRCCTDTTPQKQLHNQISAKTLGMGERDSVVTGPICSVCGAFRFFSSFWMQISQSSESKWYFTRRCTETTTKNQFDNQVSTKTLGMGERDSVTGPICFDFWRFYLFFHLFKCKFRVQ